MCVYWASAFSFYWKFDGVSRVIFKGLRFFSQILLYCVNFEKDQNKSLYFLKLFMDQQFDNAF